MSKVESDCVEVKSPETAGVPKEAEPTPSLYDTEDEVETKKTADEIIEELLRSLGAQDCKGNDEDGDGDVGSKSDGEESADWLSPAPSDDDAASGGRKRDSSKRAKKSKSSRRKLKRKKSSRKDDVDGRKRKKREKDDDDHRKRRKKDSGKEGKEAEDLSGKDDSCWIEREQMKPSAGKADEEGGGIEAKREGKKSQPGDAPGGKAEKSGGKKRSASSRSPRRKSPPSKTEKTESGRSGKSDPPREDGKKSSSSSSRGGKREDSSRHCSSKSRPTSSKRARSRSPGKSGGGGKHPSSRSSRSSRSRRRERSGSRGRRRRSRSRSKSRSRRDKDKDRKKSGRREGRLSAWKPVSSTSSGRGRKGADDGFKIDKEKLLQRAKENVRRLMKEQNITMFQAAKEQIGLFATGRSVEELTEFCRHIVRNEEEDAGSGSGAGSGDESKPAIRSVVHPFQVKERPSMVLNIRNAVQLPTNSHQERAKKELEETRRLQFPVSSGQDHRKKEDEMDIEEEPAEKPAGAEKVGDEGRTDLSVVAAGPVVSAKSGEPVFDIPLPEKKPLPEIIGQRVSAMSRLSSNPFDVEAISLMCDAQDKLGSWVKRQQKPGQFTGQSTGIRPLTYQELSRGPQAWVKRDQLIAAAPVCDGVGKALLERMGWREGEGLGKAKAGPLEPLALDIKMDKKGLGNEPKRKQPTCPVVGMVRPAMMNSAPMKPKKPLDFGGKHPVSILMEMCSKNRWDPPVWRTEEEGPPHQRVFLTTVTVRGEMFKPDFYVNNKKQSKMEAAMTCLKRWGLAGLVTSSG